MVLNAHHLSTKATRGVEAVGDLNSQVKVFTRFQSLATHVVAEGLPFEKLHGEEILAVDLANLVDRANVWMIQGRGSASFAAKALGGLKFLPEGFDRDPHFRLMNRPSSRSSAL